MVVVVVVDVLLRTSVLVSVYPFNGTIRRPISRFSVSKSAGILGKLATLGGDTTCQSLGLASVVRGVGWCCLFWASIVKIYSGVALHDR